MTEANLRRRVALVVDQGVVFESLGRMGEWHEHLARGEPAAIQLGDRGLLGALYGRLAWLAWYFGDSDRGVEIAAKAADLCESAGNFEDGGQAYIAWQVSHFSKADYGQALALKEDVLRMMARRFNVRWYSRAVRVAAATYWRLGRWPDAIRQAEENLRVCTEFSDDVDLATGAWVLSQIYNDMGDLDRAIEYGDLAARKSPLPDKRWHQGGLARAWCRTGQARRGIEIMEPVVAIYRAARAVPFSEWWAAWLGERYWLAGEDDRARLTFEEHLAIAERCGLRFEIGAAHRFLGEIAARSNPAQVTEPLAAPHFLRSISVLREIGAENELARAHAGYGRLLTRQGDRAEARRHLARALDIFERLGTLIEPEGVREALAELRSL